MHVTKFNVYFNHCDCVFSLKRKKNDCRLIFAFPSPPSAYLQAKADKAATEAQARAEDEAKSLTEVCIALL